MGGWTGTNDQVEEVELGHGDPRSDGATVARITTVKPADASSPTMRSLAQALAQSLWRAGGDHAAVRAAFADGTPIDSWPRVTIAVSGHPAELRFLGGAHVWGALGTLGEHGSQLVALSVRDLSPERVALTVVSDLDAYHNGSPRDRSHA